MRVPIREFQKNTGEKFEIFKRFPSASGSPLDPTFLSPRPFYAADQTRLSLAG